jgi:hypothetical protein
MQLKKKCLIIPHKRSEEFPIVEKEITGVNDIPVEKVILGIISRIYKEGVNAS